MTDTVALLPAERRVETLIADSLAHMGYEVARVRLTSGARDKTLQVMIDKTDGSAVNVDDCEQASIQISAVLDVHDPISGAYRLEVSSPGLDRPLTRPKHFAEHIGYEIKTELRSPLSGRKRFKGVVISSDDASVTMQCSANGAPEDVVVPFALIANARLVLTDELLAAAQQQQQSHALSQE